MGLLTGPMKPSSPVLVKGLSEMGTPPAVTGTVCTERRREQSGCGPQIINQLARSQGAGGRAQHSHCLIGRGSSGGPSPMFPEGKRLPPGWSPCWLRRPSSGPRAQRGPHRLVFLLYPLISVLPVPGPEKWHSLGSPNTQLQQIALACLGSLNSRQGCNSALTQS